jgi:hypothetical protein
MTSSFDDNKDNRWESKEVANREFDQDKKARRVVQVNTPFGVPEAFVKQTSNENEYNILKGQLNKLKIRPQILNEHAESSREVQSIVTATNEVGQIFKASQDNINTMYSTLESAEFSIIDNFESYATDNALQLVWEPSNNLNTIDTTIVKTGLQSMRIPLTTNNDTFIRTIASTDYTNFNGAFDFRQSISYPTGQVSIFIGDGINTKSRLLNINVANNWTHFEINEEAMTEDQVGLTDITAITKIGFLVVNKSIGQYANIDNLITSPPPGNLGIELWDMGSVLPESGVTSLNDGTQYVQIGDISSVVPVSQYVLPLLGGKRLYHLDEFKCGIALEIPSNELLIPNNYYAIVFKYVDTNVNVYGPDSSLGVNYYESGYAFNTTDNTTAINAIGEFNDLAFSIFSTQDVYIFESRAVANSEPNGLATYAAFIEDSNMKITDVINTHGSYIPIIGIINLNQRPMFMEKGGNFELYYNDDFSDGVSKIVFGVRYYYVPPNVNG